MFQASDRKRCRPGRRGRYCPRVVYWCPSSFCTYRRCKWKHGNTAQHRPESSIRRGTFPPAFSSSGRCDRARDECRHKDTGIPIESLERRRGGTIIGESPIIHDAFRGNKLPIRKRRTERGENWRCSLRETRRKRESTAVPLTALKLIIIFSR